MTRTRLSTLAWVGLVCLMGGGGCGSSTDDPSVGGQAVAAYYLPHDGDCTVLVDFECVREELQGLDSDGRMVRLAQQVIEEFQQHGAEKAKKAQQIELLAVYIKGRDKYGRPNFANRTDLLKIRGSAEEFHKLNAAELKDVEQIRKHLDVEVFESTES